MLLMPTDSPPAGYAPRGKVVCTCLNVSGDEIAACLNGMTGVTGDRLAALQAKLKCGTNCGSCVPELKQMIANVRQAA